MDEQSIDAVYGFDTEVPTPAVVADHSAGQIIMPFYIICDTSASMSGEITKLNDALGQLFDGVASDPVIDDIVTVSVISFGSDAEVVVPLGPPSETEKVHLSAGGGTSFAEAWRCYADAVERDHKAAKAAGSKFFRPCVFFLTDGEDLRTNWEAVFAERLAYDFDNGSGNKMYPFVVAFGFREAKQETLSKLAYPPQHPAIEKPGRWYWSSQTSPESMLQAIIPMIAQSVVSSGQSAVGAVGTGSTAGIELTIVEDGLRGSGVKAGNAGVPQVDMAF